MKKKEERTEEEQKLYDVMSEELQKQLWYHWFCPVVNNWCNHNCLCYEDPYITEDCLCAEAGLGEYYNVVKAVCCHRDLDGR